MMRRSSLFLSLAALLFPVFAFAAAPTDAIRALGAAYDQGSVPQLDALLTADYRFHTSVAKLETYFAGGFDRNRELLAAKNLFEKYQAAISIPSMDDQPDPEHPDSSAWYRIVRVSRMSMTMKSKPRPGEQPPPQMNADASDHVFHVVRGVAASLPDGRKADPQRWYIREWFEDVSSIEAQLAAATGRCDAPGSGPESAPGALAVQALDSPLCPTLKLRCTLPAAEGALLEVFDVGGRRLSHQELAPAAAGRSVEVEAGAATPFAPGAYFVRLSQGRAKPVSKMVLVAK